MFRTTSILCAAALFSMVAAGQSPKSGEFTQQAVHQHGTVTVNLALDGPLLVAELEAPAINVIGFERAPRTADERQIVGNAESWLRSGTRALGVPASAGCRRTAVDFTAPDWAAKAKADGHNHDHDHDHGSDAGEQHADYRVRMSFTCSNPAALAWAELWLLQRLRNVEQTQVNLVTATRQQQRTLSGTDTRVALR